MSTAAGRKPRFRLRAAGRAALALDFGGRENPDRSDGAAAATASCFSTNVSTLALRGVLMVELKVSRFAPTVRMMGAPRPPNNSESSRGPPWSLSSLPLRKEAGGEGMDLGP